MQAVPPAPKPSSISDTRLSPAPYPLSPVSFSLLLILLATLLVLGPEFFFLRDQFGWRMNTIFKFYYQAWLLWGIAAAYGSAVLLQRLRGIWTAVFGAGLALLVAAGLVYPVFGVLDKTGMFQPAGGLTLDGSAYLAHWAPDELAAIHWLQAAPEGNIVEAVKPDGGQYTEFARISANTGLPTVLGWVGHESQWRGSDEAFRGRQADVERIYSINDWNQTLVLLNQYSIRYVIVGPREHSVYHVAESKFKQNLTQAFQQGSYTIYEVPLSDAAEAYHQGGK